MSGTYQGKTGEQWREMSRTSSRRSQESFERCDTDGFLSQWAADTTAREYDLCADLADANSQWEFTAVFTTDGDHVDARKVDTKFGWTWLIRNENGTVTWFSPSEARNGERRLKADTKKGYLLGVVRTEGRVVSYSSSRWNVSYRVIPVEGADVEVVDNGSGLTEYQDRDW
jgi:hypothetical protein